MKLVICSAQLVELRAGFIALDANAGEFRHDALDLAVGAGNEITGVEAVGDDGSGTVSPMLAARIEDGDTVCHSGRNSASAEGEACEGDAMNRSHYQSSRAQGTLGLVGCSRREDRGCPV